MSFHRENVVWKSPDGTWNRAFYVCQVRFGEDDPDPEWDVEYDFGTFSWLSRGHPTPEAAQESWPGANPGGHALIGDSADSTAKQLEDVASRYEKART